MGRNFVGSTNSLSHLMAKRMRMTGSGIRKVAGPNACSRVHMQFIETDLLGDYILVFSFSAEKIQL